MSLKQVMRAYYDQELSQIETGQIKLDIPHPDRKTREKPMPFVLAYTLCFLVCALSVVSMATPRVLESRIQTHVDHDVIQSRMELAVSFIHKISLHR